MRLSPEGKNLNECDSKDRDVKGEKERGEGGG
jgi:hypothetical protein